MRTKLCAHFEATFFGQLIKENVSNCIHEFRN